VLVIRAIAGVLQVEIIVTPLTIASADLDDPCSRVSKNDARVHGTAREHGSCLRTLKVDTHYQRLRAIGVLQVENYDVINSNGPSRRPVFMGVQNDTRFHGLC